MNCFKREKDEVSFSFVSDESRETASSSVVKTTAGSCRSENTSLFRCLKCVCVRVHAQRKHQEIRAMRSQLKKIEDLGAAMEEALILDNKYTEHSTVGLAQQWDQLDQLGMRMQHNLEQQIQARYPGRCTQLGWDHES